MVSKALKSGLAATGKPQVTQKSPPNSRQPRVCIHHFVYRMKKLGKWKVWVGVCRCKAQSIKSRAEMRELFGAI